MAELRFEHISAEIGAKHLLTDISTKISSGELVVLVGPNGAGKTTLLKTALGQQSVSGGTLTLNGKPLTDYSVVERARQIAYLPQTRPLAWPLLVKDTVALGRFAYGAATGKLSPADQLAIKAALNDCALGPLALRQTDHLSGGELARVHCARAFASQTPLLLADEPITALDPKHQLKIMHLIRRYVDRGGGALVVMHDISLAAAFADRMIWLQEGRLKADGPVHETLTVQRMKDIFDVTVEMTSGEKAPGIKLVTHEPETLSK